MFCFGQGTENTWKVLKDILKDLVLSQLQFESPGDLHSPWHWFVSLLGLNLNSSSSKLEMYVWEDSYEQQFFTHTNTQQLVFVINLPKYAKTMYLQEKSCLLSFVFQDMPPQYEMLSPRPRCLTWKTKKVKSLAGRYLHAITHIPTKTGIHVHKHAFKFTHAACQVCACICANTHVNMHAPGFLRFLLCFISLSHRSQCFFTMFNLWSHYLPTHLSPSKWFLFIFCKSPNQSWKRRA